MKSENMKNQPKGMRVKSSVKAGTGNLQHNQTIVRGMRVKSNVKAGGLTYNHNQTIRKS